MSYDAHEAAEQEEEDNRYFPRWEVESRVLYHFDDHSEFQEGRTKDLSCSGARITISKPAIPRQNIKLRIYLSKFDQVDLSGRVVWLKSSGQEHEIGIDFSDITSDAQGLILKHAFEINKQSVIRHWFKGWIDQ